MKKTRNVIIGTVLVLLLILGGLIVVYRVIQDENAYNVTEKKYIIDMKSKLITVNVLNDVNIFGRDGKGLYYDFLNDFQKDNELTFDIVTTSTNDVNQSGLSFTKGNTLPDNSKLFYTDHYVLVGKDRVALSGIGDVKDPIGYLNKDQEVVTSNLQNYTLTLTNYEDKATMLEALENGDVAFIIVPLMEYLDVILDKLYTINYHISEMKDYYYLLNSPDATLNSIMSKYYNEWNVENQNKYFNEEEYALFTDKLKITEKELDVINKKTYNYGFVNNAPYDVKNGGVYGGTMSRYVESFADFSGIEFEYVKYKNLSKLLTGIKKGKVDLFLNNYAFETSMTPIESLYRIDISFLMSNSDARVMNNLNTVKSETVYVKSNSNLNRILKSLGLNILNYKNDKELKDIFKNNGIVAMDYGNYLVYKENNKDINERFRVESNNTFIFASQNDTMFNRLFGYYISTIDKNETIYTGVDDYYRTHMSGTLIYKITKYAIIIILGIGIVVYIIYKASKKTFKRKKIKRSDKMKYIDMLTSLKNRNYLNENIPIWNRNTIYPQAIIVIDLNGIQELNDTYGYIEGDKQIQAAANALIKTQLDNSEVMRTDGNEFTIYLVGYSEKQVISYIKKLSKEFRNLPHDKKAAIGFAMIMDDLKLINDAINEATEKMKENKALTAGESDEEKI